MKSWSHSVQRIMVCNLIAVGLALLPMSQAHAAVPSPANSTCPPTVFIAADGSCCFDVIVRDLANNPIAGSTVHVDFGTCVVVFCPAQPPGVTIVGNGVNVTTNAAGVAHICVCATFTPSCTAAISADGVLLCSNIPLANCGPTGARTMAWGRLKMIYR